MYPEMNEQTDQEMDPTFVADLVGEAGPPDVSGAMTSVLVHRTRHAQLAVQAVPAGGELQAHHHTGLWDYFVGLSGQATITLTSPAGATASHVVGVGGFLAVPPRTTHHIGNHDGEVPFVFLLTQAPYSAYDFVTD